jgi:hypothetical protein
MIEMIEKISDILDFLSVDFKFSEVKNSVDSRSFSLFLIF